MATVVDFVRVDNSHNHEPNQVVAGALSADMLVKALVSVQIVLLDASSMVEVTGLIIATIAKVEDINRALDKDLAVFVPLVVLTLVPGNELSTHVRMRATSCNNPFQKIYIYSIYAFGIAGRNCPGGRFNPSTAGKPATMVFSIQDCRKNIYCVCVFSHRSGA